jgi:hypothetical protein
MAALTSVHKSLQCENFPQRLWYIPASQRPVTTGFPRGSKAARIGVRK